MAKHKTSFLVTVQTEDVVKATTLASALRSMLTGCRIWQGQPANRKGVMVTKVTVSNVGEK